ncbi:MAG: rRNA maturation RNase YbeY [Chthoniobacterales bacterium]
MSKLNLQNHQRKIPLDLPLIRQSICAALPLCAAQSPQTANKSQKNLRSLEEIDISIVSDKKIAQVHKAFLNDPTPTDVITFPYGEIIVSADTAQRLAKDFAFPIEQEISLYIIHGFLHLQGYDDHTPAQRNEMHARQNEILKAVFKNSC